MILNFSAVDGVDAKFITRRDVGKTIYVTKETTDANGKTRIQTNVELVLTEENIDGYIGQYVKIKGKVFNPLLAKLYLSEAYDIEYDLYNHDDPQLEHPFQQHLMTDKKKIKKHGQFQYFVQRYHSHQIQKYFGISLIEFLAMPLDKIDDLFELSLSWLEEEITQVEELQDGLEDATKRGDKQMKGFSF